MGDAGSGSGAVQLPAFVTGSRGRRRRFRPQRLQAVHPGAESRARRPDDVQADVCGQLGPVKALVVPWDHAPDALARRGSTIVVNVLGGRKRSANGPQRDDARIRKVPLPRKGLDVREQQTFELMSLNVWKHLPPVPPTTDPPSDLALQVRLQFDSPRSLAAEAVEVDQRGHTCRRGAAMSVPSRSIETLPPSRGRPPRPEPRHPSIACGASTAVGELSQVGPSAHTAKRVTGSPRGGSSATARRT